MRIAVVGSGVAGLTAAHVLAARHDVTVFEAAPRLGGHVNTVDVHDGDRIHQVDVGFVVFNETTYPRFVALLDELAIATQPSEMTFSVTGPAVEYGGGRLAGVLAQPANVLRPSFHRLLWDIDRFNKLATRIAAQGDDRRSVADFLAEERFGRRFAQQFLLPLGSAVWSVDADRFEAMPVQTLAVFLHRHEFLRMRRRPTWRTISGGATRYVEALVARSSFVARTGAVVRRVSLDGEGAQLQLDGATFDADRVVLAVPAAEALALLSNPSAVQQDVLGAFSVTDNAVTLHHDERLMPRRRAAWASWNYRSGGDAGAAPKVTYWMNRLQRIESTRPLLVSLNSDADIDERLVVGQWRMRHPVLDAAALEAHARHREIEGAGPIHFCGAYWGSGFHEDGVVSALRVCAAIEQLEELAA